MIFDELSNAACRLSLGGPGAELEGGVFKHPPPGPARVAPSTGPARVNKGIMKQCYCLEPPLLVVNMNADSAEWISLRSTLPTFGPFVICCNYVYRVKGDPPLYDTR